jgi:hypothetical protein
MKARELIWVSIRGATGLQGIRRAGRYFHTNETVRMEVVSDGNPTAPHDKAGASSMERISQAGVAELKADQRFVVHDRADRVRELGARRAAHAAEGARLAALESETGDR